MMRIQILCHILAICCFFLFLGLLWPDIRAFITFMAEAVEQEDPPQLRIGLHIIFDLFYLIPLDFLDGFPPFKLGLYIQDQRWFGLNGLGMLALRWSSAVGLILFTKKVLNPRM